MYIYISHVYAGASPLLRSVGFSTGNMFKKSALFSFQPLTRFIHLCIEYRHVPVAALNSFASSQTLSKANAILFV